jgi:hypothetical protein
MPLRREDSQDEVCRQSRRVSALRAPAGRGSCAGPIEVPRLSGIGASDCLWVVSSLLLPPVLSPFAPKWRDGERGPARCSGPAPHPCRCRASAAPCARAASLA